MFSNSMMNDQTNISQLIHKTRSRTGSSGGMRMKNDDQFQSRQKTNSSVLMQNYYQKLASGQSAANL